MTHLPNSTFYQITHLISLICVFNTQLISWMLHPFPLLLWHCLGQVTHAHTDEPLVEGSQWLLDMSPL
jgi:hypothetical protein